MARFIEPDLNVIDAPSTPTQIPYAVTGARVHFYPTHRISTHVEAEDGDKALAIADDRFRRCAAALALVTLPVEAPSCSVRITWIAQLERESDLEGIGGAPPSYVDKGVREFELVAFGPMSSVIDVLEKAREDQDLQRLLETWYRAEQIYPVAARQDDRRWALLEYARLLEDIGNLVSGRRPMAEIKEAVKLINAELAKSLESDEDGSAVLKAAEAVREERRSAAKTRIRSAGLTLNAPEEAIANAERAWTARNEKAGHSKPGTITLDEIYWARAAATIYLTAYLAQRFPGNDSTSNGE
jgi:hypothetical protein